MVPSCTYAHERHIRDAIVRLRDSERGGLNVRLPTMIAEALLRDQSVVAGDEPPENAEVSKPSELRPRVLIDALGVSRTQDAIGTPG